MIAAAWCSIALAMGYLADSTPAKFAWLRIQTIGSVFVPAAWIVLVLQFRARLNTSSDRLLGLLAVEPVIMLMLVWTSGVHGLFWGDPALVASGAMDLLVVGRGPAFWFHQVFAAGMLATGIALLARDLTHRDTVLRAQATVLAGAGALVLFGHVITVMGVLPYGIDATPIATLVGGAAIGAALFRYRMLSLMPIARDAVMEGTTEGAIILDDAGRVVDMNPAAERITGVGIDQALGSLGDKVLERFGKVGNEVPLPTITHTEVPGADGPRYFELRLSRMQKADSTNKGRLVVLRDVTQQKEAEGQLHEAKERLEQDVQRQTAELTQELQERKFAEIALRDSEERSRQVIDSAYDAFVSMNANGAIIDWNPQAETVFGWTREEVLGKDLAECILPVAAREAHRRGLRYYLTSGDGPRLNRPVETTALHRDGQEFEVEMTISPGIVKGLRVFNSFIHDITERKQAEQDLRDSNSQLGTALAELETAQQQMVQQERLRALGQMASGIAHEFNNALSPIVGFSELLIVKPNLMADENKSRRYLEGIRTAAQDATNVVSRLREFYRSREELAATEPIDLNALVSQTVTLTQPKWGGQAQANGVSVRVSTDLNGTPIIEGDASSLREVLTNLIFNAVDAMQHDGRVLIHTGEVDGKVILQVADTGMGMSEQVLEQCLDPFFSTKGDKGTGLGLALVHGIMDRHGGFLDIQSEVGKGTTFTLTFPASQMTEKTETAEVVIEAPDRLLRVLAVDDDRAVLEVIEAIVQAEGHEIILANSAREALERLKDNPVDVVLTDLAMPLMNGDKLAQLVKRMRPGLPVIMLTGLMNDSEAAASVDTVLSKPVSPAKLRDAFELVTQAA